MENINVLSLFSGIGAFEKALDRKGIGYNLVNYCEFDKYASKSYSAVHNVPETLNLGDITKVNIAELEPYSADLVTYGFPCQDLSNAGKQRGFEHDGKLTRSGLFFYASAIIGRIQPKVAICENVKALVGKKFTKEFETVLSTLEDMGYKNYWQVLNAKDYGIPQNRERVFIISIREDIDRGYEFPKPKQLTLNLLDLCEKRVDEKYFMSEKSISYVCATGTKNFYYEPVIVKENTKKGYTEAYVGDSINFEQPNSKTRRGRVGKQVAQTLTTSPQQCVVERETISYTRKNQPKLTNISPCLQANYCKGFSNNNPYPAVKENLRIRKLTPFECWRLMGFDDEDFYKAEKVNSNTQLYKQAGNSIVVNVLEAIFDNLKGILYD